MIAESKTYRIYSILLVLAKLADGPSWYWKMGRVGSQVGRVGNREWSELAMGRDGRTP